MRRSMICATVTCFAFAWAVLWPDVARAADAAPPAPPAAAAPAQPDPVMVNAKQHFEAGRAAYNANDLPTAIREFKAAEALRPSPILAYNIGLANEKLGRRHVAVRYYQRYLESSPKAANRAEVEGRISTLQKALAAQPEGPGPQAGQPGDPNMDNPPPPPPPDPNAPPTVQADPYAPQSPVMVVPPRRKTRWWIGLIVGLSVAAVVATVIALAVVYTRNNDNTFVVDAKVPKVPNPLDRSGLLDRSVSTTARGVETAPLVQVHF